MVDEPRLPRQDHLDGVARIPGGLRHRQHERPGLDATPQVSPGKARQIRMDVEPQAPGANSQLWSLVQVSS